MCRILLNWTTLSAEDQETNMTLLYRWVALCNQLKDKEEAARFYTWLFDILGYNVPHDSSCLVKLEDLVQLEEMFPNTTTIKTGTATNALKDLFEHGVHHVFKLE